MGNIEYNLQHDVFLFLHSNQNWVAMIEGSNSQKSASRLKMNRFSLPGRKTAKLSTLDME